MSQFSRRDFLRAAAVLGAGVATTSMMVACSSAEEKWDKEAGIVIVGSGTAAYGALYAASAGESVLIVDKSPTFGGTSAISDGGWWLPANPYMEKAGLTPDSKEEATKYLLNIGDGAVADDVVTEFVDACEKFYGFNTDVLGIEFATTAPVWQDEAYLPGFKEDGGRGCMALLDDTDLAGLGGADGGEAQAGAAPLWALLRNKLDKLGVQIMLGTRATRLITNADGEVTGVAATGGDGEIRIKASKGVLLATGGFDHNPVMMHAFLRKPTYYTLATPDNTGDGHIMGMRIGAALNNMSSVVGISHFVPDYTAVAEQDKITYGGDLVDWGLFRGKPNCVVVNRSGRRFANEGCPESEFTRAYEGFDTATSLPYPNLPSFFICDSTYVSYYTLSISGELGPRDFMVKAETLRELAEKLAIDPEGLEAQITEFNADAITGADRQFHKGETPIEKLTLGDIYTDRTDLKNRSLGPVNTPPYYGCAYGPGQVATSGGLLTNAQRQVLDNEGNPIPRLYASGVCGTLVSGAGYVGGLSLTHGAVTGIMAVEEIAKLPAIE